MTIKKNVNSFALDSPSETDLQTARYRSIQDQYLTSLMRNDGFLNEIKHNKDFMNTWREGLLLLFCLNSKGIDNDINFI